MDNKPEFIEHEVDSGLELSFFCAIVYSTWPK